MADILQNRFIPLFATVASCLLLGVQSTPSPPSVHSSSRGPPVPQYYATSSQQPPSVPPQPSSSLAPTSPVYTAQRIRPSNSYDSAEYSDDPYPSTAHLGTARTSSGVSQDEDAPENTGFVQPIDFSSLLKDVGSSPKGVGLDIGATNSNPLFASESRDTFKGFFGSTKNPFEELTRLNTASSDHRTQQSNDEDNIGFVDPNVQFRSLFDSAGTSAGFKPEDFLGSKSENVGLDPSKGSQTRAYPSFTYSGRNAEREDSDRDYNRGGEGPNRYRSSYRQVGSGNGRGYNDYNNPQSNNPPDYYEGGRGGQGRGQYDDYDGISNSPPTDSYDDDGGNYYAGAPGRRGGGRQEYERATPRYSQAAQETSHSPQAKPRTAATESKNPRCRKVEKQIDYNDDHASFTEPDEDYDPSTYQGRYKRQARKSPRSNKRPMVCWECQDEHGRYAEKCSFDSKGNPKDGAYFHSESTSFSDNGRRPKYGKSSRPRRSGNRQRSSELSSAESTTVPVNTTPEIAESEPKVIDKRQANDFDFGGDYEGNNEEHNDPYDARTGSYRHPTGYEGPPLSATGGGRGGGEGGYHDGGHGYGGGRGHHGGGGGGGRGGNDGGYHNNDYEFGPPSDYEREAAAASREFDFTIPREFDPDVQLRVDNGNNRGGNRNRENAGNRRDGSGSNRRNEYSFTPQYFHNPSRRPGPDVSASSRRENLDDFDIGYNDYIKNNFPEAFNSPGFSNSPGGFSTPSYSASDYDYKPNYYHRPRGRDEQHGDQGRHSPEVSHNDYNGNSRGYGGGGNNGRGRGPGGYVPDKQHTQPSHNFSPPPGFFSEDSPAQENYDSLGNLMKEFSSKTRDGCRKVIKGDMTCFVCKDARGANKEECMYTSDDPKNKAMAYHEVTEYSSPTASVLPAPLHATLLGYKGSIGEGDDDNAQGIEGSSSNNALSAQASSLSFTSTPAAATEDGKEGSASEIETANVPSSSSKVLMGKKATTTPSSKTRSKDDNDKKKSVRSVKSTRVAHSSTLVIHERSKRSPREEESNYDFDY